MSAYDALVYDLDGTLVQLAVDWAAVTQEAITELESHGLTVTSDSLWDVLQQADTAGLRPIVEDIITAHEEAGARQARRLPLADELPATVPVGVCSLNAESACRIALEQFDLAEHVTVIIGRDSVSAAKPDPEPLYATLEPLGVSPEHTLFIGDSERDAKTATRAGTEFMYTETRRQES